MADIRRKRAAFGILASLVSVAVCVYPMPDQPELRITALRVSKPTRIADVGGTKVRIYFLEAPYEESWRQARRELDKRDLVWNDNMNGVAQMAFREEHSWNGLGGRLLSIRSNKCDPLTNAVLGSKADEHRFVTVTTWTPARASIGSLMLRWMRSIIP